MANAPKSIIAIKLQLAHSVSLCIGLAFVAQLAPLQTMPAANAADFSRAKKIFVPPTRIPRRFDSESSSTEADTYSSSSSSYDPGYTTPTTAKSGKTSGKYGLVPPPPPLTPTLLPPSLLHLPAQSASTEPAAGKPAPQRWSVAVQKTLKRASTSPKVASFLDQAQTKAQNLIKEGKLDQAQELLKSYVKSLPRDPALKNEFAKVTVQRAQQLLSDQNIDAAGKMAREALSVQPQNQAAHTVLAQVLKKQGMSVEHAPDRVKIAKELLAKGRVSEAEMEYYSAIKLKPSADAYVGLGDLALKNNNKEKAKADYQKALELEPHSGAALRQMGIIRLGQSDIVGANSDLSRALVVDPHDKVASQHLIELWQKQVTQSPQSANSHLGLARAHQLSGDLQAAQSEYKKVVEIDPNNANLPAARQSFKLALARQEAHHAMDQAHNLEAAGALQEAHAKISEAVKLCPGDSAFKLYQAQLGEKLGANSQLSSNMGISGVQQTESSGSTGAAGLAAASGLAAAGGMMAAASTDLLPGLAPRVAPSIRNSVSAGQAFNGGVAEAPPAMSLDGIPKTTPMSSAAHVSSMGGFLTSLRNYSLQQKAQSQQAEDATHAALKTLTDPTAAAPSSGASVAQSPVLASASANLASVNSLLASIGAPTGSGASSPTADALGTAASSAATALSATTPAAPAAASATPMSWQKATARNLANQAKQSIKNRVSQYATKAKTAAATPSASSAQPASQPLSLADQNKQLQAQLEAAQQQISALKGQPNLLAETPTASPSPIGGMGGAGASPTASFADAGGSSVPAALANNVGLSASPAGSLSAPLQSSAATATNAASEIASYNTQLPSEASAATAAALSIAPNAANASVQSILQSLPPSLTSSEGFQAALANLPNSSAALQTYASTLPPATQSALQAALKPPIATTKPASTGAVRLELEGVKPSPVDIRLNVVLHNDQKTALAIPASTKAIINMKGQPQRIVKISFPNKNVPPNGEMHGVIKVPGHNLSPTADLYIPDLLPGQGIDRDLHLTVPISFK